MEFEDIVRIWQSQTDEAIPIESEASLLSFVRKQHKKGWRWLFGLNLYVLVVGVPCTVFSGWLGLKMWPDVSAFLSIAATALFGAITFGSLASALRQRALERSFDDSIKARIECLLSQVNLWVTLLGAYLRWVFPALLMVWIVGVTWWASVKGLPPWGTAYIAFSSIGFCGIYVALRRILQTKYGPRSKMLEGLLRSIDGNTQNDS